MTSTKASKLASLVLSYLESSGDLELLPEVISSLTNKSSELGLTKSAIVTTATKLEASDLRGIQSYIKAKYGDDLKIVQKLDPSLIAGFKIKIGDEVIDSSLLSKLENIRKDLV